jgi:hypothetical protein
LCEVADGGEKPGTGVVALVWVGPLTKEWEYVTETIG